MPPTEVIDDDGMATFEPATDAIDFYELLEGMRVVVEDAIAIDPVNSFGEVWALLAEGSGSTGFNGRDAIVMREGDQNPERILLDLELVEAPPGLEAGACHWLGDRRTRLCLRQLPCSGHAARGRSRSGDRRTG